LPTDPKSAKNWQLDCLIALLRYARGKAVRKILLSFQVSVLVETRNRGHTLKMFETLAKNYDEIKTPIDYFGESKYREETVTITTRMIEKSREAAPEPGTKPGTKIIPDVDFTKILHAAISYDCV